MSHGFPQPAGRVEHDDFGLFGLEGPGKNETRVRRTGAGRNEAGF